MALVLCTGVDRLLMETRKLILQRAGHTVVTAMNEQELAAACAENQFDVAVIGQTISPKVKKVLVSLVRKQCTSAKVLELYPMHQGRVLDDADSWLCVPVDVPEELAERVGELARQKKGGAARG